MQLLKIEAVDAEIAQRRIGRFDDVVVWEHVVCGAGGAPRPLTVLRCNLGRGNQLQVAVATQQIAEQAFAMSVTIGSGGIEERAAEFDGMIERASGLRVL